MSRRPFDPRRHEYDAPPPEVVAQLNRVWIPARLMDEVDMDICEHTGEPFCTCSAHLPERERFAMRHSLTLVEPL